MAVRCNRRALLRVCTLRKSSPLLCIGVCIFLGLLGLLVSKPSLPEDRAVLPHERRRRVGRDSVGPNDALLRGMLGDDELHTLGPKMYVAWLCEFPPPFHSSFRSDSFSYPLPKRFNDHVLQRNPRCLDSMFASEGAVDVCVHSN